MLRIQLLGDVRAWAGERELVLGGPQPQAVLAMLALRSPQSVLVEELAAGVCGEDAPVQAVRMMRTYIGRLRKELDPCRGSRADSSVLSSVTGGYRLDLSSAALDAAEFEELAGSARNLAPEAARETLGRALALWRGEPLAGLPGPYATAQRRRLEEARTDAAEQAVACDLALGEPARAAASLTALVAEHPLRERLHELLMLALYRCGRPTDALHAYTDLRQTLIEELGVEPGPRLQHLHQQILRSDPDLQPGPLEQRPAPTAAPVPAQLPAPPPDFTGRSRERATVIAALRSTGRGTPVVVISGMGGAGKTALALAAAHHLVPDLPHGHLYADLRGAGDTPADPSDVLAAFLLALGHPPDTIPTALDERAAAYRSLLAGRHLVILLDNAADSAQVRPLLPGSGRTAVVVTSRRPLGGLPATERVEVQPLPAEDAAAFVARVIGPDRAERESADVAGLAAACAYHPLSLRIAAARLAARPRWRVADLVGRLTGPEGPVMGELVVDDLRITTCFELGRTQLTPAQERAFRLLAVLDAPRVSVRLAAAALDTTTAQAEDLCEQLVDAAMLEAPAPGAYRFHDLVRAYARALPSTGRAEEGTAALRRATIELSLLFAAAHRAVLPNDIVDRLVDPAQAGGPAHLLRAEFPDRAAAVTWTLAEFENAAAITAQSRTALDPAVFRAACMTLLMLTDFTVYGISNDRMRHLADRLLTSPAAQRADHDELAVLHLTAGMAAVDMVELDLATPYLDRAIALSDDNSPIVSRALERRAQTHRYRREFTDAEHLADRSLEVARRLGCVQDTVWALVGRGRSRAALGRTAEGIADLTEAISISETLRDLPLEGTARHELGRALLDSGRPEAAIPHFERGIRILRSSGLVQSEIISLNHSARAHLATGNPTQAIACATQAFALVQSLSPQSFAHARYHDILGRALLALGEPEQATPHLRHAIAVYRTSGVPDADILTDLLPHLGNDQSKAPIAALAFH
ncbi:AfsR/SARP family transcriptional regulator [Streptomyces rubellomurinus]|uniref:AfsR/SARP family transcriptional regulator n=1 Tax=Streptomyces rubellomurinus (strain ATCC 31215) TaxID=359131 RepID=UPI000AC1EBA0|nr:BTAD domain-containing putative transcriptional regulator [Streptomyces rubellomurinus]